MIFLIIAVATLLAIAWFVQTQNTRRNALEKRSVLFAYMYDLRQITASAALLAHRFDDAVAAFPSIGHRKLRRLRDDGVAYAYILALSLISEFEDQHPSLRHRLGHSPLDIRKREKLDQLFTATFGHPSEARWAELEDDNFQPLVQLLAHDQETTDKLGPVHSPELIQQLERHSCDLGKLVGNFQTLEYILRWFLYQEEGAPGIPVGVDWHSLSIGDQLPVNALTNFDSLGSLIDKFNRIVGRTNPELLIDRALVDLRDALAHGRVSAPMGTADVRLMKFGKPIDGFVSTVFSAKLTSEWMEERRTDVMAAVRKVASASDSKEELIGPIP
jgi:hypothetical protein